MLFHDRQLQAAIGYLELGMVQDAREEIEQIAPEVRDLPAVLTVRVEIYRTLGEWEPMEVAATLLCKVRPDDAYGWINSAYATRRAFSLEQAKVILLNAATRFPGEATIPFNLACYEAQLGHLDAARQWLANAVSLQPACRERALADPDLAPLHGELGPPRG